MGRRAIDAFKVVIEKQSPADKPNTYFVTLPQVALLLAGQAPVNWREYHDRTGSKFEECLEIQELPSHQQIQSMIETKEISGFKHYKLDTGESVRALNAAQLLSDLYEVFDRIHPKPTIPRPHIRDLAKEWQNRSAHTLAGASLKAKARSNKRNQYYRDLGDQCAIALRNAKDGGGKVAKQTIFDKVWRRFNWPEDLFGEKRPSRQTVMKWLSKNKIW